MLKPLAIAALLATASASLADAPDDQLLRLVSQELPDYTTDVAAEDLSRHQLATIYMIMHSGKSRGDRAGLIQSVIGGRNTLRGLLFN